VIAFLAVAAAQAAQPSRNPPFKFPPKASRPEAIEAVTLGPLFDQPFVCMDHPEGNVLYVGDALGTDCMVVGGFRDPPASFGKLYRHDGSRNADWYGWGANVLAPFDGVVTEIAFNPITNETGSLGKPPASAIVFRRSDGLTVDYGHVRNLTVKQGDRVKQGQAIGKVGNNGPSRNPHIHVGAYRGLIPYQIRWDQRVMGKMGIGG
jgi:hypothetical protein